MHPAIRDGENVRVEPVRATDLKVGEIVLCDTPRGPLAHRLVAIAGDQVITRGDANRGDDPPVGADQVLGRVGAVHRAGLPLAPDSLGARGLGLALRAGARLRRVAALATMLAILAHGVPAWGEAVIRVGTFNRHTAEGNQAINHGLGEEPRALIIWTMGKTSAAAAPSAGYQFSFGVTDGATSRVMLTRGASNTQGNNRRTGYFSGVIAVVAAGGQVEAQASVASWNATSFTLNWSTNTAIAGSEFIYYYIAIGGEGVQAHVDPFIMPSTPSTLSRTTPYQPDVTLIMHAGGDYEPGGDPLNTSLVDATFGLGAFDAFGRQWAMTFHARHVAQNRQRTQRTGQAIIAGARVGGSAITTSKSATMTALDENGYALTFDVADEFASPAVALSLKGVNLEVGFFNKQTATGAQSVTFDEQIFEPTFVFLASQHFTGGGSSAWQDEAQIGLGASDGTFSASSSMSDTAATSVHAVTRSAQLYILSYTTGIFAQATLASFDENGWTQDWTQNDDATDQLLSLTLAPLAASAVTLVELQAHRHRDGVEVVWHTAHEANNLGFHVYREHNGQVVRLTRALVAGSALMGQRGVLPAGRSYRWWDPAPVAGARYWLEDWDVDGTRTRHAPVPPTAATEPRSPVAQSRTLATLGGPETASYPARRTAPARGSLGSPPILAHQWALAAGPAVKLEVRTEGLYRVTRDELVAAGLDPAVDPRRLRLIADGFEVPMLVHGEETGTFDPGDTVELYGVGLDRLTTDARTYWIAEGAAPGARVGLAELAGPPLIATGFSHTVERRDRRFYLAVIGDGESDNFVGDVLSGDPVNQTLEVAGLDPAAATDAILEVRLQGLTPRPDASPGHRVAVALNGLALGELAFDGRERAELAFAVPHALLADGDNVVTLTPIDGAGTVSFVQRIRLTYARTFVAADDALQVAVPAGHDVTVGGFSDPAIRALDVTDPDAPIELAVEVVADDSGYAATVAAPGEGERLVLVFSDAHAASPDALVANQPSAWHDGSHGADLVILTHAEFRAAAERLAERRRADGLDVVVIDVQDVYDEFGFGTRGPYPIRAFLAHAHTTWAKAPRYALLIGDATFDPRDHLGFGVPDFVPTKLVPTRIIESASDDWLGDFDGDGVPEIVLGRLPVRTAAQADALIDRLVAYQPPALHDQRVLMLSDEDPLYNFSAASRAIRRLIPGDAPVTKAISSRDALVEGLAESPWLVHYLGHGSVEIWAGNALTSAAARQLDFGGNHPIFVNLTCWNGFFHDLYSDSLGEALLLAEGGAIAVWASSTMTNPGAQSFANRGLMRGMFSDAGTLGEAVRRAKAASDSEDVRNSWILLGDPSLPLPMRAPRVEPDPVAPPDLPAFDGHTSPRADPSVDVDAPAPAGCGCVAAGPDSPGAAGGLALLALALLLATRRRQRRI